MKTQHRGRTASAGNGVTGVGASSFSRWVLRGIGIFYVLVAITLVADLLKFGVRAETFHKVLHVVLGAIYVVVSYKASQNAMKMVLWYNALFFGIVALIGWFFRDFGGLDAFNTTDTLLHTIVASVSFIGALSKR